MVFSAVLESEPGVDSYGIVKVFEDRLVIEGYGDEVNRFLKIFKSVESSSSKKRKSDDL